MWKEKGLDHFEVKHNENAGLDTDIPEGCEAVCSNMPGSVWKILVKKGDKVKKGDTLIIEESMKMEFNQDAAFDGEVVDIYVKESQEVCGGQILVALKEV